MEVIFCDNHLLIVEKPYGIATQPDLHLQAKAWIKKEYQKPGEVFLEPIHRLDKLAGGLVLFARTSKALTRLNALMRGQKIRKTYFAFVEGTLDEPQGTLEHYLVHDDFCATVVDATDPEGKKAILEYSVLKHVDNTTLLRVNLVTGRYHQIRAQFAAIEHPILGDSKYGSTRSAKHMFLYHAEIAFPHPVGEKLVVFSKKPLWVALNK